MKNLYSYILFFMFLVICLPTKAVNPQLTEDEKVFLKSLSGKWNPVADYSGNWGDWVMDITIKYVNGILKISYPSMISDNENLGTRVTSASYDRTHEYISFNYSCNRLDDGDITTITVSITIPYQTDIEDTLILYRKIKFSNSNHHIDDGEIMYYKH